MVQHRPTFEVVPEKEWRRLKKLTKIEEKGYRAGYITIAGVDEAGRGPLAGPVFAAACIIPRKLLIPGVDDCKKLLPAKREAVFKSLVSHPEIIYGVGMVEHDVIDEINIFQATIQAMLLAISQWRIKPDFLLVDGLSLPHTDIPCEKVIKGDEQCLSIAAASVIAKVSRDNYMQAMHEKYPQYGFNTHKGYATEKHLKALKLYGPSPIHRLTFKSVDPIEEEALV